MLPLHDVWPIATQIKTPETPVNNGPFGILFDFNEGCRVELPDGFNWRVRFSDLDTGSVLLDQMLAGGLVTSPKKYYIRFRFEVWRNGIEVFVHDFDAVGQNVLARMEVGALGDQIAWLGHAIVFARNHQCRLTCVMTAALIPLFSDAYPDVQFITAHRPCETRFYATYKICIFYNDNDNLWHACDYRQVGLCKSAAYILGTVPEEVKPLITADILGPPICEPYVCIAVQATSQNKYWNNPLGWQKIVSFLKSSGFRVISIDQKSAHGDGVVFNHIPHGAEDQTGDRPLTERVRWLKHAAFFVGLSSGLSWLAWIAGCKVVMISGFTHPINEFYTPYRVINYNVCNSCSNDIRVQLDPNDFMWCPRHRGTTRMFECTKLISAEQVIEVIREVPIVRTASI